MAEPRTSNPPVPGRNSFSIYFMFMMLTMFIIFIPAVREGLALAMGTVLEPIFGFNGYFPILTLIFAGIFLTLINTYARHYFMDWIHMGKTQQKFKALSKQIREAYKNRDMAKVEKLRKVQQKMMPEQMQMSSAQMKPMAITMFLVIAIFTWLFIFLQHVKIDTFSVPWSNSVSFTSMFYFLPYWMILYSFLTAPIGQVMTYIFKTLEFKKRIKNYEVSS